MEWRNPAYNAQGTIDCEINHPVYGWIPFTAAANDTGATFDVAAMVAEIISAGNIAPYVPPPEPDPPTLAELRPTMRAYRLAFEDACSQTAYGEGTLLEAIDALLALLGSAQTRRYNNITIFERLKPEVTAFLQNPQAINLTDTEVDNLFILAMEIEAGDA